MAVDMRYGFCFIIIFQHFIFCILFFRARFSLLLRPAWGRHAVREKSIKNSSNN